MARHAEDADHPDEQHAVEPFEEQPGLAARHEEVEEEREGRQDGHGDAEPLVPEDERFVVAATEGEEGAGDGRRHGAERAEA